MRFVFPVLFSMMIVMLFVSFYSRLPPPLSFRTSESDLPKLSRPNPLQVLSAPPIPAPEVTPEPALDAIAATPAPAPEVTPEPALAAVAATPAPAPELTPEPKLDAAPKAQLAPEVLPKVERVAGAALKAEVTGESAMNQPMQPIPPA